MRAFVWGGLLGLAALNIAIALGSPFLASRNPAYIIASFAGIAGLILFLAQPLMAHGYVLGMRRPAGRLWHKRIGIGIVIAVVVHVGGLYLTSPPDTMDALLLRSPTPFSVYGVVALWGVVLTALLALLFRLRWLRYGVWRHIHIALAFVVICATIIHAVQIEALMGPVAKLALCAATLGTAIVTVLDLRVLEPRRKRAKR